MKKHIFNGCATALITPFAESGNEVDFKAFEKLLSFQLNNSIDALVVAGTTGEAPVLTKDEKLRLCKTAIEMSQRKVPVIVGCGSNNTEEAVRKCNDVEKEGVDGLLIVTPYYNKSNQQGIIEHYNFIADRVSTPIIIYSVPSRTGVTIKPETYKALAEHNNIIAVKEASSDISAFSKMLSLCGTSLDCYSGNDDLTLPMMSLGAKGVISVASNVIPKEMSDLTHYCLKGNFSNAAALHYHYLSLFDVLFCDVNPIPVKCAMSLILQINKSLRLPLTRTTKQNEALIYDILSRYNLIK